MKVLSSTFKSRVEEVIYGGKGLRERERERASPDTLKCTLHSPPCVSYILICVRAKFVITQVPA